MICASRLARDTLAECREDTPDDADADGERDRTDRCSGTPPGEAIDAAGCSVTQFCAVQPLAVCSKADWRNDEPAAKPGDCARQGVKPNWFCRALYSAA